MSPRFAGWDEPAPTVPSPLLAACRAGDVAAALRLLPDGADPNERDTHGATPLHLACAAPMRAAERPSLVRALLHAGAGPFACDDEGNAVSSDERKTAALLSAARHRTSPPPIVIFLGREHPLLRYFTEAMPACSALADKLCCIEFRAAEERREWPTPFSLFEETSPDVPFGVQVVLTLGASWTGHDALRRHLLPRDDDGFVVRGGPHNDAPFDACWRQLPRSRETLRFEDLRRRYRGSPRPAAETFDALDALFRSRAEAAWRVDREDRPATTVPRDAWSKRPERGVFGLGEAHDLRAFVNPIDDQPEARAAYDPVADVLWGSPLAWNEVDEAFARAMLADGRLQRIEDVADASGVTEDVHARLRAWYTRAGVSEADQLRAALFSARFCRRYPTRWSRPQPGPMNGRELWVATRPLEDLVAALSSPPPLEDPSLPSYGDRARALAALLLLLDQRLGPLPTFRARARALWERVRHVVRREDVEAMLARDADRFASWIVPGATTADDCASAVAAMPSRRARS